MAKRNETTTKFKVDISELKKAMQEARKEVAYANSEFKAVSSTMDDWGKSSDGIKAKLKQLNTNLKAQETVLSEYEKTLEEVKKEYGENSAEAREYATKLNNQIAVVNKVKSEISGYEDSLKEVSKAEKIASMTGKDVAEVLDDVGEEAKDAEGGFTVLKGAIATFVGNGLTALVGGVKSAIGSFVSLASETREYRNEMSKLETAFTTAGGSAKTASNTYKQLYSVLGDEGQAVEASSHLAKLTTDQKELNKWTHTLTGVYAQFGASLPIESLTEASNETAKTGAITGALADALNWAGVNEDDFQASLDECNSEQERQKLILETLNGLYGEAGTEYKKTNKSVIDANKAQASYTETLAELGAKAEPITTAVKNGFTSLLQEGVKLIEGVDIESFTKTIESGFAVVKDEVIPAVINGFKTFKAEVVPVLKNEVLPAVKGVFQWLIDNKELVVGAIGGIVTGLVAFKVATAISGAVGAFKTFFTLIKSGTTIMKALNLAFGISPIGLIVTAVGLLVAGFITLWNTCEPFKQFWLDLWENIRSGVSTAVSAIGKFFTETIPNFFKGLINWIKTNWKSILLFLINPFAGLFQYFYDNNSKFKEFVNNAINTIKEFGKKAVGAIGEFVGKIKTFFTETIPNFFKSLIDWIKTNWVAILLFLINPFAGLFKYFYDNNSKFKEFVDTAVNFIKELPKKVWTWLVNTINKVTTWRKNMITKAKEAALGFINKVIEYVKQLAGKVWTWLVAVVTKVVTWRQNMIDKAKEVATGFINKVIEYVKTLPQKVADWLKKVVNKVSDWGKDLASKGKESALKLYNAVVDKVKEITTKIRSIGKDIVTGLYDGINDKVEWLKNKIKSFVGNVTEWIQKFFEIGSPSKVMEKEVGRWLPEGIAVGISKNAKSVLGAMKDLAVDTVGSARDGLGSATATLSGSGTIGGGVVNNFYQTINSPKQLSRLDIYRQSKNLLGYAGGGV